MEEHKHTEHTHHKKKSKKITKTQMWMITSGILLVLLVISIFTSGFNAGTERTTGESSSDKQLIFLQSDSCTDLCDELEPYVKELTETTRLSYTKAKFAQAVPIPGYVIVDNGEATIGGFEDKITFANAACELTEEANFCREYTTLSQEAEQEALEEAANACDTMTKSAKPEVEAWVVSRCPYGVQMSNGLQAVQSVLGDDVSIRLRYITDFDGTEYSSMHGATEYAENERQVCLREEQNEVFWDYIKCYVETGDIASCETSTGVDSDKLQECLTERVKDYMQVEYEEGAALGITGSPTLMMEGERVNEYNFGGRSPASLQEMLCCAMETESDACSTALSSAQPPTGFGVIEESATTTATSGEDLSC